MKRRISRAKITQCAADNCRVVSHNGCSVTYQMDLCQEHALGIALDTHYLKFTVERIPVEAKSEAPGQ